MPEKIAYIYPAFVLKYTKKEQLLLSKYSVDLQMYIERAASVVDEGLREYNIIDNNFIKDEQRNQYMTYILSCAFADVCKKVLPAPDFISGFSLGIYAAAYAAESIDFETGLKLIQGVYNTVRNILQDEIYSMASVVGFSIEDIKEYIQKFSSVEIVIQNGIYSFVLAGKDTEVSSLLSLLHDEGAIHINRFEVACPYHSKLLLQNKAMFENFITGFSFKAPNVQMISMIEQKSLVSENDIKNEIILNITSTLNFFKTIQFYLSKGVHNFIEVGPGESLLKSSKFIEGEFQFNAIAKGRLI